MTPDALAARLLRTFLEELDEQLRRLDADLLALEESPADAERLASVFRIFHTLKGSARVVGAPLIERVSHELEARLAGARDGGQGLEATHFALLFRAVDALRDAAQRLESRSSMKGTPLEELARELEAGSPVDGGVGRRVAAPAGAGLPTPPPAAPPPAPPPAPLAAAPIPRERRHASGTATAATGGGGAMTPDDAGTSDDLHVRAETHVRVASEKLDDVLAAAGALQVVAGRAAEVPEQLEVLRETVNELRRDWARRSTALRREAQHGGNVGADLRVLDAATDALRTLTRDVARVAAVATRQAGALTRASTEVGEQARRLRLRPFSEACEALPRIVHDLEADTGTEVHLTIEGGDVQADRAVLDGMREAVLHLVRNAVDHGLEPPAERRAAGKPEAGELRVCAALHGEQLTVTVSDDGRGLDTNAIRGQLQRRGLPVPGTDAELALAVFEAGFSTRASATEISGRGVGLDVVRSIMTRLRGDVRVQWTRGRGTTFRLESPITLATQRVLFVDAGGQTLAIPTAAIARLHRLAVATLPRIDGRPVLPTHAAAPMPLVSLAALLGPPLVVRPPEELALVVSIEVGERRLALVVDAFGEEEEIVVRPIEHRGARPLPQLAGAAM
ncbi:MAG TPA: ATP-binding protein, partial [Gemmatimonadaceae bacterium]|nr:ATP-binding protein [Gemmatimonadaceae bacterium]